MRQRGREQEITIDRISVDGCACSENFYHTLDEHIDLPCWSKEDQRPALEVQEGQQMNSLFIQDWDKF